MDHYQVTITYGIERFHEYVFIERPKPFDAVPTNVMPVRIKKVCIIYKGKSFLRYPDPTSHPKGE